MEKGEGGEGEASGDGWGVSSSEPVGMGRGKGNACIHLPRNMRPRTRHRRTLRPRGKERGGQGHENVLSTPAPPVIGSNHRGSHTVRLFRSPLAIGRCNWTKIELEFREDQFSFSEYNEASSLGRLVRIRSRSRRETSRTNSAPSSIRSKCERRFS